MEFRGRSSAHTVRLPGKPAILDFARPACKSGGTRAGLSCLVTCYGAWFPEAQEAIIRAGSLRDGLLPWLSRRDLQADFRLESERHVQSDP